MPGGWLNRLTQKKKTLAIFSVIVLLLAGVLFCYEPATPEGAYYDPDISSGHGCWVFKGGKVYIQFEDEPSDCSYVYLKQNGQWVLQGMHGEDGGVLKPTLFGIKLINPRIRNGQKYWVRDGLSWVVDCREWFRSHPFP